MKFTKMPLQTLQKYLSGHKLDQWGSSFESSLKITEYCESKECLINN